MLCRINVQRLQDFATSTGREMNVILGCIEFMEMECKEIQYRLAHLVRISLLVHTFSGKLNDFERTEMRNL